MINQIHDRIRTGPTRLAAMLAFLVIPHALTADAPPLLEIKFVANQGVRPSTVLAAADFAACVKAEGVQVSAFAKQIPGTDPASVGVANAPDFAGKSFLHIVATPNSGPCGISIKPSSPDFSLAALSRIDGDGCLVIRGSIDLLIRVSGNEASSPFLLLDRGGDTPEGIRISVDRRPQGMRCVLQSSQPRFGHDGSQQPDLALVQTTLDTHMPFEEGEIYHCAVTFETAPDRSLTVKVFRAPGNVPLNTTNEDQLEGVARCQLTDAIQSGFSQGIFVLGSLASSANRGGDLVIDIAGFRLQQTIPVVIQPL